MGCPDTTITPDVIPDQIYYVTDPVLTFSFAEWTSSVTLCGAFTYTSLMDNAVLDTNLINFNAATKTFTV